MNAVIRFPRLLSTALAVAGLAGTVRAQVTVASAPVGVVSAVAMGQKGLAFPLIAQDLFVGVVAGNAGPVVTFPEGAGDLAALLPADAPLYLEVLTGPLEGERFDLASVGNSALEVALGAGTHSTLTELADGALAGARCAVRPHVTLARIQTMVTPGLVGDDRFNAADGVEILGPGGAVFHHLRSDGETWVVRQRNEDVRNLVIPPDASLRLILRSGAKRWVHAGIVRSNAFRKNLVAGEQGFSSGFPVALSPAQLGAVSEAGWVGSNDHDLADSFQAPLLGSLPATKYFLAANGTTWRRINNAANAAQAPVVPGLEYVVLKRNLPDSQFRIEVPYAP